MNQATVIVADIDTFMFALAIHSKGDFSKEHTFTFLNLW